MMRNLLLMLVVLLLVGAVDSKLCFVIEVVDEQTGRGVPMVELETVNNIHFITDSAGLVAITDPGLMDKEVFFTIKSHGYEFEKDFLGFHGKALQVKPGGREKLAIKRINIAERMYRITGEGIYVDTLIFGGKAPIEQPMLNGGVCGQDSVQAAVYRGKIYWFWGDTNRLSYPLGNFATTGATSELPTSGGLDPSLGVNLHYFVDEKTGFVKKMAPLTTEPNPIWIDGLLTIKDDAGRERLVAQFSRMKDLGTRLERGIIGFNDQTEEFEKILDIPLEAPLGPCGQSLRDERYIYFTWPYPNIRVKADWKSLLDLSGYESFTPLVEGAKFDGDRTQLVKRDGKVVFEWKHNTSPLTAAQQEELISSGLMNRDDSPQALRDAATKAPIHLHASAVHWNPHRSKWVMIGQQGRGTSLLGETWYAEAPAPEGPWSDAVKIVTHDKYSFYNPACHPFFNQQNGRYIYFEATFTNSFANTDRTTPRYEYNQIMYRLDLEDPRLRPAQR